MTRPKMTPGRSRPRTPPTITKRYAKSNAMIAAKFQVDLTPGEQLAKSGLRRASKIGLNRAASPVKASVVSHANAVKRYGFLAKSIRIRLRIYPSDRYVAVVGPSMNYARTKGKRKRGKYKGSPRRHRPAYYAHLVERGAKDRKSRRLTSSHLGISYA